MMRTTFALAASLLIACGPGARHSGEDDNGPDATTCSNSCSADGHSVVDCHNNLVSSCDGGAACDPSTLTCADACTAAENNHRSVGCEYYATDMDSLMPGYCYAAFIA